MISTGDNSTGDSTGDNGTGGSAADGSGGTGTGTLPGSGAPGAGAGQPHAGSGSRSDADSDGMRHSGRPRRSGIRARHLCAHALVAGWLALALATAVQHPLPVARWLAVHLLLLGAATTAIVVWSEHFAVAVLHAPRPALRWSNVRLAGVNLGAAGVLAGLAAQLPALTGGGCALLLGSVTAHLVVLVRLRRGALGGRLSPVAAYYQVAAGWLLVGGVLGWLLAVGAVGPERYAGVRQAHIHATLLGWVALPVLGTLFMLWPTVLGVRMRERTTVVARRVLWLAGGGLALAVTALAAGWQRPAAVGLVGYVAGAALTVGLLVRTARRRRPVSAAAAWLLAAGTGWLLLAVAVDLALLAARPAAVHRAGVDALAPVLLIGFVGQILAGALTYLLPVVLSTGPKDRAAVRGTLERAWPGRLALLNLSVPLLALPLPHPAAAAGTVLAASAGIAFLIVLVGALVRRVPTVAPAVARGGHRRPAVLGTAAGAVLTALAVLLANSGPGTPGTAGNGEAGAAGTAAQAAPAGVRTVAVTLSGMRVRPGRIEVSRGTGLRLKVTNRDAQRHDLAVADGPATPLLANGQSHTLDLGTVTADRHAWCTVPGHRAAGMVLAIAVTAADGGGTRQAGGGAADPDPDHGVAAGGPDLARDFSAGWRPRSPRLPAASGERVHRIELHAARRTVEVAPGVRQERWTFGGTTPGPTLRGAVGDVFEITLVNDDPELGHGIDFHAGALAPDGAMRTLDSGERLVYRFRAERAGAWLYHCSTAPMLQHIGNGMFGAVIIDPPDLAEVEHEYLLVSSELYLGTPGSPAQVARMRRGTPDAWAFNGVAAQYAKQPLTLRAGERARFWVVAAGPRDGVAFHIVGTVFDTVYREGAYTLRPDDPGGAQVLDLAVAQGGFVETTFPEAGHYSLVDHDMHRAQSGAHGTVEAGRRG